MKNITLTLFLLLCISTFSQVPRDFKVLNYNNPDSSVFILNKLAKQQCNPAPTDIEITKEYISQSRNSKKMNVVTGNIRTEERAKAIYFENIDRVDVRKYSAYKIYFFSNKTGSKDLIELKDKQMAEQAYAAILCLIRNSGNKLFDQQ